MAVLTGSSAADGIVGSQFVDTIFGLGGNDTLFGLGGNDTIDGGSGQDTMVGGTGDDTYIQDSRFDVIIEAAGEGRDTLQSSANVYLAGSSAEIEVIRITGTTGRQVIGNATQGQTLIGSSGNDDLRSGAQNGVLIGGGGDDIYFVDANDTVIENANAGLDTVFFNQGGAGGNRFVLGANVENLSANNASASVSAILVGNDLANTLTGLNANDSLSGLAGTDVLIGGAGNDTLDGGSNLDTLIGGPGDDTFVIADTTNFQIDRISEAAGEGRDTILASRNTNLATLENASGLPLEVEVVQVTRTTPTQVIGNGTANQTLIGNIGDDDLRSGSGSATLIGGDGNDDYFAKSGDILIEQVLQGVDSVFFDQGATGGSFTLGANFENLSANNAGIGAVAVLNGNELGNTINGLNADDTLFGLGGADVLNGGAGEDFLFGGAEADTLFSGTGNDQSFGEGGNDVFVYALGDGDDLVGDFEGAGLAVGDVVVLQNTGIDNFADLMAVTVDVIGGCEATFAAGQQLSFRQISKAQLDASDFVFA